MKASEFKKKLDELRIQQELDNRAGELNRARSVTVGTAFGGTTEITMRGNGSNFLYCLMQPAEVVELIHQLAANVGCHLALTPRQDFASWREWRVSEAEKKHLNGHVPFANDFAVFQQLGASDFNQAKAETTVAKNLEQKEYVYVNGGAQKVPLKEQENVVAIKKTVNRRNTKRTSKAS